MENQFSRDMPFEVFDVLKVWCESVITDKKAMKHRCRFTFASAENVLQLLEKADLKCDTESVLSKDFKNNYHARLRRASSQSNPAF